MSERNQAGPVVAAVFLAAGIALGGHFIGRTMYNAKVGINTAQVKGLAERRVKADRADWKIVYRVSGSSRDEIPKLYAEAEKHRQRIVELLERGGFEGNEIDPGVLDCSRREYRLRDATKSARAAAREFAENAGVEVGGIRSARQENFVVRDAGEEYSDTGKIEKDVRVVTTITFFLTG